MGDPSRPTISVCMAVRDGAHYVNDAVSSLTDQTLAPAEFICVDDGSCDQTLDMLKRFGEESAHPVRVISQPRLGLPAARNAALRAAQSPWLLLFDADDVAHPTLIQSMSNAIAAQSDLGLAFCRVRYVDPKGAPIGPVSPWPGNTLTSLDFLGVNPMHSTSGAVVHRDTARQIGGFDETLTAMADVDLAIRIGQSGRRLHAVDQVLVDYRKHKRQVTADWQRLRRNWERVFAKAQSKAPNQID
ncbi:MAG: glycosyltransferase, partial [Pseudomonadota bacterium]